MREIPGMETVKIDDYKRVRLPDAKPGQVFEYQVAGETITLRLVKPVETDKPAKFKLIMRDGFPVIRTDRVVSQETINELLSLMP